MNKRGYVGDIMYIIIALAVLGAFVMIGTTIFNSINTEIQGGDQLSTHGKELVQDNNTRYAELWDNIFLIVFSLLVVGLIISVAALGTRPEFFFIMVFIALILVGIGAMLGNVFTELAGDLPGATSSLTFIPLFYEYLAEITLGIICLFLLALYAKARGVI